MLTATSEFEFYYMGLVKWLAHLARKKAFPSHMIMHYALCLAYTYKIRIISILTSQISLPCSAFTLLLKPYP